MAMLTILCSKDHNSADNTPVPDATLQCKVNGNLITFKDSTAAGEYMKFTKYHQGTPSYPTLPHTTYIFKEEKNSIELALLFGIVSDSLAIGNYTYDSTYYAASLVSAYMSYNATPSVLIFAGDYINVNITSYSHGYISGNFTAKFTPYPYRLPPDYRDRGTTLVTEGEFKNVKCIYE